MISLIGKGKITDLQGNILTSSQQSVQNWTPAGSGSADLSYADGVNHVEFDTASGVDLFSRKINQYLGTNISVNSTMYQNLCTDYNYNADHRNWKLVIAQQNNAVKFWLGANNSKDSTNTYVSGQQYIYTHNSTYTDVNTRSITLTNEEAMFFNNYNDFCQFFMIGITFSKNYTLSFNLDSGGFTPPSILQEVKDWYASYGYTNIDNRIQTLYNYSTQNKVYLLFVDGNKVMFACTRRKSQDSYWELDIDHGNTWVYQKINGTIQWDVPSCWDCGTYVDNTYTYQTGAISSAGIVATGFAMSANSTIYVSDKDYIPDGNYLLSLLTRSTTGFTKDASKHDITLTNGNNTYTLEVNPTASQEYQQQSVLFTPASASCNLKLDLSGMQGSGIEIDVKDIGVYEIGGEE